MMLGCDCTITIPITIPLFSYLFFSSLSYIVRQDQFKIPFCALSNNIINLYIQVFWYSLFLFVPKRCSACYVLSAFHLLFVLNIFKCCVCSRLCHQCMEEWKERSQVPVISWFLGKKTRLVCKADTTISPPFQGMLVLLFPYITGCHKTVGSSALPYKP